MLERSANGSDPSGRPARPGCMPASGQGWPIASPLMQLTADAGSELSGDLRHYIGVVRRHLPVMILIVALCGGVALTLSMRKDDLYMARAEILLVPPTPVEEDAISVPDTPERNIANEVEVIGGAEMASAVENRLGPGFPGVSASSAGENDVIVLQSESTDPAASEEAVAGYVETYVRQRRQRTVQALEQELTAKRRDRQSARAVVASLDASRDSLQEQIDATPPGPEQDVLIARLSTIDAQTTAAREAVLNAEATLNTEITALQTAIRETTGGVEVLSPAAASSDPFYPEPERDLVLGLAAGLLLALFVAFLWDYLDDAVRSRDDVERAARNLPTLGTIPRFESSRKGDTPLVVVYDDTRSAPAEAYRGLVTSLEFVGRPDGSSTILITSPGAAEGKTTTAANLGAAFAETGHRTVIVDGDLRRPRVHEAFGIEATVGFSTVLRGSIDVTTAVTPIEGPGDLSVVAAGPIPPNPAELLRSQAASDALTKLGESFEVVIIDCPPVLPVADALVLARHADIGLLVATAGITSRRRLARSVEAFELVNAPLDGIVLNGVSPSKRNEYGYYGYGETEGSSSRRSRRRRARR